MTRAAAVVTVFVCACGRSAPPPPPPRSPATVSAPGSAVTRHLDRVSDLGSLEVSRTVPADAMTSTGQVSPRDPARLRTERVAQPGEPLTVGSADIPALMRDREAQLRPCYERALPEHPGLAGAVTVHATIGRAGTVATAWATGLPEAPAVATCVADRVRAMRFPVPSMGELPFVYEMTLRPSAQRARHGRRR